MPEKTLDERVADAEREGRWRDADQLNATRLADLVSRTHPATGAIAPEPVPPTVVVSEPETPPAGSFDGGVREHRSTPTLDREIAQAEATGDWSAVDAANARKLIAAAERTRSLA